MLKRTLAWLLTVLMIVGMMPISVFATEKEEPIVTITFDDSNTGSQVTLEYPSERYDTIQKLIGTNSYEDFVIGAEQSELLAYIADGRASNIVITLHQNIELDSPINFYNEYFQIPVEYAVTLDGKGNTITWADGYTGTLINVESGVNLTIKDLTIDGENAFTFYNDTTTVENGQNWYTRFVDVGEEDKAVNANVIVNAGELTLGEGTVIQNVTIASDGDNGKTANTESGFYLMYNDDLALIKSNGGKVAMDRAKIAGNAGIVLNAVNAKTVISSSVIDGNMGCGNKGGIIIADNGTMSINNTSVCKNKAMARSATILGVINGAEVTFNAEMNNNKHIGVGSNTAGAIVVLEGASQFVMNGGSISDNVGGRAGAIASRWVGSNYGQHEDTSIKLLGGSITGNTVSNDSWNGASVFLRSPAAIGEGMTIEGTIVVNANPGELEITGGVHNGELIVTDGLTASISGGTFNYDPTEWLENGLVATKNDDGTWAVSDNYAAWVKEQLLAGNSVTLDRDIVITDYDLVNALVLPSNGNGKHDERHGNGAVFHVIKPGVVLDLNGHSITWDAHDDAYCNARQVSLFMVTATGNEGETADLTVIDSSDAKSGKVDVYGMGTGMYVVCVGAEATIDGGTWTNYPCNTCDASNIFIYPSHGGSLYITGGKFEQKDSDYLLGWNGSSKPTTNNGVGVDQDETKVVISGGTFVNFDPEEVKFFDTANGSAESKIDGCAENYESKDNGDGTYGIIPTVLAVAEIEINPGVIETREITIENWADFAAILGEYTNLPVTLTLNSDIKLTDEVLTVAGTAEKIIDLNGYNLTGTFTEETTAFIYVTGGCEFTIKDSSADAAGGIHAVDTNGMLSNLIRVETDATMIIESGNYTQDASVDGAGMIDSRGDEIITVNGGNFRLYNIGSASNGSPWIFNASSQNTKNIIVNGGTFNADIIHQYYPFEVMAPKEKALVKGNDGIWSFVDAVAYVNEQEWSSAWYTNEVGYATLEEAIAACEDARTKNGKTSAEEFVTIIGTVTLNASVANDNDRKIVGNVVLGAPEASLTASKNDNLVVTSGINGYEVVYEEGVYKLSKIDLPDVVVTDIKDDLEDTDPDLTFALNFAIKDLENLSEEYLEKLMAAYGSHYVDYVLTIKGLSDTDVTFNADGDADGYLAGRYAAWENGAWLSVPFEDVTVANGESLYIMEYAAKLMGQSGLRFTLAEVAEIVVNFDCGVYFTPEFINANPDAVITLQLKVFTEDADGNKIDDINVATNVFRFANYVAMIAAEGKQTQYFETLDAAIDAAADGETVTLINNIDLAKAELQLLDGEYDTYFLVEGKSVTVDLNGKKISGAYSGDGMLVGVFSTDNNGHLTLTGNGTVDVKAIGNVYALIANYGKDCSVIIKNGTYTLDKASSALIYSDATSGETPDSGKGVVVYDGSFTLGNVNTGENGSPWIFNVSGKNEQDVYVVGGTYNFDVSHQYWAHEVYIPFGYYCQNNNNGTWSVEAGAVAVIEEINDGYIRWVGYADLSDALAAIVVGGKDKGTPDNIVDTVMLLKDTEEELVLVKAGVVFNLNGHTVKAANVLSFGDVIDNDGTTDGKGGIVISNNRTQAFVQLQPKNTYMPIYDTANGCYKFFEYTFENKGYNPNTFVEGSAYTYGVNLKFTNKEAYSIIANSEDSGISLTFNVKLSHRDNSIITFVYSNQGLKDWANASSTSTKTLSLTMRLYGYETIPAGVTVDVNPIISTISGVVVDYGVKASVTV